MSNYSEKIPNAHAKNTSWHKIMNFIPKESYVLDVGCSSGKLGEELKSSKNCKVYGTEIDEGDYKIASKVLDKVFLFNIETDPLPKDIASQKFDVIIFADVIEHLVNPVETLKKVKELLATNGRIVFSIPNMSHISVRLQLLGGEFNYNETGLLDKTHLHFYDYKEVQRIFVEAGLQMVENDATILKYPRSFLRKKFKALGLEDEGFIKRFQHDMNAQTFQFVGYAGQPKVGAKVKNIPLSTTTPEQELTAYIDKQHEDLEAINETNRQLADYIKTLQAEKANLEKSLVNARASTSYKLGQKFSKITSSAKSKQKHDS